MNSEELAVARGLDKYLRASLDAYVPYSAGVEFLPDQPYWGRVSVGVKRGSDIHSVTIYQPWDGLNDSPKQCYEYIVGHIKNWEMTLTTRRLSQQANKLPGAFCTVICPSCQKQHYLKEAIIHLNDDQHWDRDRIADWLDEQADNKTINIDFPD